MDIHNVFKGNSNLLKNKTISFISRFYRHPYRLKLLKDKLIDSTYFCGPEKHRLVALGGWRVDMQGPSCPGLSKPRIWQMLPGNKLWLSSYPFSCSLPDLPTLAPNSRSSVEGPSSAYLSQGCPDDLGVCEHPEEDAWSSPLCNPGTQHRDWHLEGPQDKADERLNKCLLTVSHSIFYSRGRLEHSQPLDTRMDAVRRKLEIQRKKQFLLLNPILRDREAEEMLDLGLQVPVGIHQGFAKGK